MGWTRLSFSGWAGQGTFCTSPENTPSRTQARSTHPAKMTLPTVARAGPSAGSRFRRGKTFVHSLKNTAAIVIPNPNSSDAQPVATDRTGHVQPETTRLCAEEEIQASTHPAESDAAPHTGALKSAFHSS